MKKKLITLICCIGYIGSWAQVGIGTDKPNDSAELSIESNTRGLLIPRIALGSTKDVTTILAGNLESLLLYNTTTNKELTPGFYYWNVNHWNRIATSMDIPDLVKQELSKNLDKQQLENWLSELILKTQGNVLIDKDQLYYWDDQQNRQVIDFNEIITSRQSLTVLSFDPLSGILVYKDENGQEVSINLKNVVQNYQGVSKIDVDYNTGIITFLDQNQQPTVIDLSKLAFSSDKVTYLKKQDVGLYQYINEQEQVSEINIIGDFISTLESSITTELHQVLDQLISSKQNLTSLSYDPLTYTLSYKDENLDLTKISLKDLVQQTTKTIDIQADVSSNIAVSKSSTSSEDIYSLSVPIASTNKLGVVSPGKGLVIDSKGVLSIEPRKELEPKDLIGSKSIMVNNGQGAVLQKVSIDFIPSEIDLASIGGSLNLNQIPKGEVGDVLSVNQQGQVQWSVKPDLKDHSLEIDNSTLISKIDNLKATLDLEQAISSNMLKELSVNRFKINSDVAGPGLIKNEKTGALEVDFEILPFKIGKGKFSSETLNILGGESALLHDVQVNIAHGLANQVLTTNPFGNGVDWKHISQIAIEIDNKLVIRDGILTSIVNNKEAGINLTHKITTDMLQNSSVTSDKIDSSVLGTGLYKDAQTGAIHVDFTQGSMQNIESETLEITSVKQGKVIDIKPGKANQVLVTKGDESGVEWVNANTLICKDPLMNTSKIDLPNSQMSQMESVAINSPVVFYLSGIFLEQGSSDNIQQIDLYSHYQSQYAKPIARSNVDSFLPVFAVEKINFFITNIDSELFEITSLSSDGILSYRSKQKDIDTNRSALHVAFTVK